MWQVVNLLNALSEIILFLLIVSQIATFLMDQTTFPFPVPVPVTTFSGHVNKAPITTIVDLNKKRKLQAEQLGLPLSKHKCCKRNFTYTCDYPLNKNPEAEEFHTHTIKGKSEGGAADDGSELESAKDSNSFGADSDSAMSVYGEAKFEPEYAKTYANDQPSTPSANWDSRTVTNRGGEHNPPHHDGGFQVYQNVEEHLQEFGKGVDYTCSEYGNDSIEHCTDKELEDMLFSDGVNPNIYVLSSGRWSVNQEAQPGPKKPTIDQEFEQYFSMLML